MLPREAVGSPHATPSSRSRCRSLLRPASVSPQVQLQLPLHRLGFQPQPLLRTRQIALQRHRGSGPRHLAQHIADHKAVVHEPQWHVRALAHHGPYGVGGLGQPGQWATAHRGEGVGQPHRLDDVRRRHHPVLVAQQPRHLRHPALDGTVRCGEQMPVPTRRVDARAVPADPRQPPVRPRHPRHVGLGLGEPLEQRPIGGHARLLPQRGHVPGPAHHGHLVPELPLSRPQLEPHVRLAHQVPVVSPDPVDLPQCPHRLLQRGERRERVGPDPGPAPVLDHVLPPALGIVVTGRLREYGEGVDPHVRVGGTVGRTGLLLPLPLLLLLLPLLLLRRPLLLFVPPRQRVGRREVDEAGRDSVLQGPPDRHPLGENSASGQKAERPGSSTTWARSATGGRMSFSAASGMSASASGGPSISTTSGVAASSAARTARADPGP